MYDLHAMQAPAHDTKDLAGLYSPAQMPHSEGSFQSNSIEFPSLSVLTYVTRVAT